MNRFNLKTAQNEGMRIARQYVKDSLPIDLFAIAQQNNIDVQEKNIKGASGMLLRHGNLFGIMYSSHIKNEGFQRFSIAHELGHYFLEGHLDHVLPEGQITHKSSAGFSSDDSYELEADYFASGLLMPDDLVLPVIKKEKYPGLSIIKKIAESCKTSLVSSAIRYVSLSESAVAMILSEKKKVVFGFLSQSMKSLPELSWPVKNSPVPVNSLTEKFNNNTKLIVKGDHDEDEIDIRDWFGGSKSVHVKEEVQGLGSYGKTLTVLSCSEDLEEICNNEEEMLLDRWTPKF